MRLMPDKSSPVSEYEMQSSVADYFGKRIFRSTDSFHKIAVTPKIYREVRIPTIGRISDVIIRITDRRIINIECKLHDYGMVIRQATDHLKWADYSYVCLFSETYLPAYELDGMITNGIGLLLWHPNYMVEVLQSGFNKNKDKQLRETVLKRLTDIDRANRGKVEECVQLSFDKLK